jgi:hypothetical protein
MVIVHTEDEFEGYYYNRHIFVTRKHDERDATYHIQVRRKDGTYLYDGWWVPETVPANMMHAVKEALRGSKLIKLEDE